ncbi:hypothetical protein WDW37_09360 [Bdellovibrionota bacterium FG-1]
MKTTESQILSHHPDLTWVDRWLVGAIDFIYRLAPVLIIIELAVMVYVFVMVLDPYTAFAGTVRLPGDDISAQMEGAGTLLKFLDTAIFGWVARLLCGLCVGGAAWSLKEARFGSAVVAIVSALLFGTAPTWVKNIFSISGSSSVFSQVEFINRDQYVARFKMPETRPAADRESGNA